MTNSQKYKTLVERARAFNKYCVKNADTHGDCKLHIQCHYCHFAWLELEAEEEKVLPCPFCGAECRTAQNRDEAFVVGCDMCCYASQDFESKDETIAAHNRVARAVMDSDRKGTDE